MTELTNKQLVFITAACFSEGKSRKQAQRSFKKKFQDGIISIQENPPVVHQKFHKFWNI